MKMEKKNIVIEQNEEPISVDENIIKLLSVQIHQENFSEWHFVLHFWVYCLSDTLPTLAK